MFQNVKHPQRNTFENSFIFAVSRIALRTIGAFGHSHGTEAYQRNSSILLFLVVDKWDGVDVVCIFPAFGSGNVEYAIADYRDVNGVVNFAFGFVDQSSAKDVVGNRGVGLDGCGKRDSDSAVGNGASGSAKIVFGSIAKGVDVGKVD